MTQSIVEAYQKKYEDEDEVREDSDIQLVFVKRKHFKLFNLILDNCHISEIGSLEKLEDICNKVTECDLSHNSLSDWNEIFNLLDVGKQMEFLNLSHNQLQAFGTLPSKQYTTLKCLALNGNTIQWSYILTLLPFLPELTNLNIGHNNISSLPCDTEHTFPTIVELNLIHNNISTFGDVADLAYTFPNLQTLVLSDNPLKSFGDDEQVVAKFDKVTKLHVNNITINSWEEVSKLRWFPSLNDVRMVHWDLFGDMKEEERRMMLGVLLPGVSLINGSPITDRDIAERWYMRRCQANGQCNSQRYQELYEKYGELPELGDISLGYETEVISLTLRIPDKGVEILRSFSLYDTYKAILQSVENEVKYPLSINFMLLHKQPDDVTVYKQVMSPYFATLPENDLPPGYVLIRDPLQMLYQTCRAMTPSVQAEEGDCIVFKRATKAEVMFDAATGIVRNFQGKVQ